MLSVNNLHKMNTNRIKYFDIAKGILISLLCFSHFPHALAKYGIESEYINIVTQWHYIFQIFFMQAFFFITGYVTNFEKDIKDFIKDDIKSLFIPALFFTFVNRGCELLFCETKDDIYNVIFNGTGFWFLYALFLSKLIVKIMHEVIGHIYAFVIMLTLVPLGYISYLLDFSNYCYHQQVFTMTICVYTGMWLRNRKEEYDFLMKYSLVIFIVSIGILTLLNIPYSIISGTLAVGSLKEIPIYITCSLLGTFAVLRISKLIDKCTYLENIGKLSLCIYGFHFLVLSLLVYFTAGLINFNTLYVMIVYYLCICVSTCFFSYYLSKILMCTRVFRCAIGKW